jgi:hypothetical protein
MLEKATQDFDKPVATLREAASKLGAMWCGFMHDSPMWPIHGQYQCRACGRHYPVPWFGDGLLPARRKLIGAETSRIHPAPFQSRLPSL